jgi:putative Mg2+ transporter-C (MgtC) family protein
MPAHLLWDDIAIRLLLTLAAGAVIGLNRERGHAAGLRTTILLCLAGSLAMILANLILDTRGKAADSFIQMDPMRLPLGILAGMGFIGGGAILRRGDVVKGVTTAATIWIATVIGLCFGAGQAGLGASGTLITAIVLWALRRLEDHIPHERHATLAVTHRGTAPLETLVAEFLTREAYLPTLLGVACDAAAERTTLRFEVRWQTRARFTAPTAALQRLAEHPDIIQLDWSA